MCSFNCCVGESLLIGNDVRLQICEAERGHVSIALHWPPGRKKTMVEIISPRDEGDHPGSSIVGESTVDETNVKRLFALVMGSGSGKSKKGSGK